MKTTSREQAQKRLAKIQKEAEELRVILNSKGDITDRVKTFADACIECGTTEVEFDKKYSKLGLTPDAIAYQKLIILIKAFNEGWTPDWDNKDQRKWYPYFNASPFGFAGTHYGRWSTATTAGSRLCYRTSELAEYSRKQFVEIYEAFIM